MRDDAPAGPGFIRAGADSVDDAGDLAAGDHGQVRSGVVAGPLPFADRCVDQMHAAGRHGDPNLIGCGLGVGDVLIAEVLGRAELVLANRVHSQILGSAGDHLAGSSAGEMSSLSAAVRLKADEHQEERTTEYRPQA
jgi:hypothetical protein